MPYRSVQKLRYKLEYYLQKPIDWSSSHDRNALLYESADGLARLHSPFVTIDDTFILQEYFLPHNTFKSWWADLEVGNQIW
jgi:hypothetical protein